MSLLTNLVVSYPCNEGLSTNNLIDQHNVGPYNLTENNSPGTAAGVIDGARTGNGSNQYFSTPSNGNLQANGSLTIEVWISLASLSSDAGQALVAKYMNAGNQREFLLFYNHNDHSPNDRFAFDVTTDGSTQTVVDATSFGQPSLNVFNQVVAWFDSVGGTINICVNNGTVNSTAFAGPIFQGTANFVVGAIFNGATYFFDGSICLVRKWDRVLTNGERTSLYNGGAGLAYASFGGGGGAKVTCPLLVSGQAV